jgi:hypothetical protein
LTGKVRLQQPGIALVVGQVIKVVGIGVKDTVVQVADEIGKG